MHRGARPRGRTRARGRSSAGRLDGCRDLLCLGVAQRPAVEQEPTVAHDADHRRLACTQRCGELLLDRAGEAGQLGERERPASDAADRILDLPAGELEETVGRIGGGALPLAELPSFACAVEEELAAPLRSGEPPVVGVVRDGRLLLDCRTLSDAEAEEVAAAVKSARG